MKKRANGWNLKAADAPSKSAFAALHCFYSAKNQAALARSIKEMQEGRVICKTLEELEASYRSSAHSSGVSDFWS